MIQKIARFGDIVVGQTICDSMTVLCVHRVEVRFDCDDIQIRLETSKNCSSYHQQRTVRQSFE